ncbi:MAG: HNH endonuclease [Gemmatimonadetes bacterium]|nr:HNH endonuclease [Gemmatimonadota bacterium]
MMQCLVYNTTGEPLELVPSLMGLALHLRGKAVILEVLPGRVARSVRLSFPLPKSVVLCRHRRVRSRVASLSNEHLFLRDEHRCAYCGRHRRELGPRERLTRDHLVPRARGGADTWLNVVTACSTCNHRKDDRLAEEVGHVPRVTPWVPTRGELVARRLMQKR